MGQPWFVAPSTEWVDQRIRLSEDETHHATRVLRVAAPDVVSVTDGAGNVARCAVSHVEDGRLVVEVLERHEHRRLKPEVIVYQGAAKGQKVDDVVERLAELGVAEMWVYESERAVVQWHKDKMAKLTDRWRSIARSAAKQSRNPFVLRPMGGLSWLQLVRKIAQEPYAVVLWEKASLPLRTALFDTADRVALVVGPEGGLTREEAEGLADAGGQLVSLGPRVLRTENAPVVATSAILYHYGLIG